MDSSIFNDQLADTVSPQAAASDLKESNQNKSEIVSVKILSKFFYLQNCYCACICYTSPDVQSGGVSAVKSEFDEAYFQQVLSLLPALIFHITFF